MNSRSCRRYAIVSPVRNEARLIRRTLQSVVAQSEPPLKWIVVDDGSTDGTASIVREYAQQWDYIRLMSITDNDKGDGSDRLMWAAEAIAFNIGIREVNLDEYDYIVKLDGDLSFGPEYFATLMNEFDADPKLGMASGYCYQDHNGRLIREWNPKTHVRGPCKMYRTACFREIGGIEPVYAWDALDELKAQMAGWRTRCFDLIVEHLKPTGSVGGLLRAGMRMGRGAYLLGYHPLFALARGARLSLARPHVLAGVAFVAGYIRGCIERPRRVADDAVVAYLRRQQLQRLRRLRDMTEIKSLLGRDAR